MGQEAAGTVKFAGKRAQGKALLETSEILFHPARGEFRLRIPFAKIQSARAMDGKLHLTTPDGEAVFDLGAVVQKWLEKIKNPKSRLDKLGVKLDASVALVGSFPLEFLDELRGKTRAISMGTTAGSCDWIFLAAESTQGLSRVAALAKSMKGANAFWIVYPKGQKQITENDVLAAGRKAGLKDVKVVGFSITHTALKFVIPVARR